MTTLSSKADIAAFLNELQTRVSTLEKISLKRLVQLLVKYGFKVLLVARKGTTGQIGSAKLLVEKANCRFTTEANNVMFA